MKPNHIDYDYQHHAASAKIDENVAKQNYMRTILLPELYLRGEKEKDIFSLLYSSKKERLYTYLIKEEYLSFIFTAIEKSNTTRDAALVIIEQCIPCSLHIDLRITEKLVKSLL